MSWLDHERGDTLDAALALAAERSVPLLVSWSAAWCPPCNELQLMVFDDPQFARFHDVLVLLHIDGDAPGAQRSARDSARAPIRRHCCWTREAARSFACPGA